MFIQADTPTGDLNTGLSMPLSHCLLCLRCLYNFKLFGNIVCEWLHIQCTNSHLLNRALFITLYLSPIESFIPPPEINTVLKFVFFKLLLFLVVSVISLCSHKNGIYSSLFFFLTLHE